MLSGARGFQILARRLGVELSQAQFNDIKDIDTKELDFDTLKNSLMQTLKSNRLHGNYSENMVVPKRAKVTVASLSFEFDKHSSSSKLPKD